MLLNPLAAGAPPIDLVLVETAVNDGGGEASVQESNELLIVQLLSLSPRPAVMYLHASSRLTFSASDAWAGDDGKLHLQWNGSDPSVPRSCPASICDVQPWQMDAVRQHGLSYVSCLEALAPFTTNQSRALWNERFKADSLGHPSILGQELIAAVMAHAIVAE